MILEKHQNVILIGEELKFLYFTVRNLSVSNDDIIMIKVDFLYQ